MLTFASMPGRPEPGCGRFSRASATVSAIALFHTFAAVRESAGSA